MSEHSPYTTLQVISRVAGSIGRFPLSAKIAAALVLAVIAAHVFFAAYVIDSLDNPRRAGFKFAGGLLLLLLSGWLWISGR